MNQPEQPIIDPAIVKGVELERQIFVEQLNDLHPEDVPSSQPLSALHRLHPNGPYHSINDPYVHTAGNELQLLAHATLVERAQPTERLRPSDPDAIKKASLSGSAGQLALLDLQQVQKKRWKFARDFWTPPIIAKEIAGYTHLLDRLSA